MAQEDDRFIAITPAKPDFDRFVKIIGKADRKNADRAWTIVASMLLAVLSWLAAHVGRDEARRIYVRYGEDFFATLDRHTQ